MKEREYISHMSTNSTEQQQPQTPEQWKILALTERIGQLTAQYENQVTDLRVALTMVSQELEELKEKYEGAETGN